MISFASDIPDSLAGTVSPVLAQGHVSIPGGFLPCLQLSAPFLATKLEATESGLPDLRH